MVVKLGLALIGLCTVIVTIVVVTYRYFKTRAEQRHELKMKREDRDYDTLMKDLEE